MGSPRRVTLTTADIRSLTVLEAARACAIAGVRLKESQKLLESVNRSSGDPADDARAAALLYAYALMIERRTDAAASWEDAQTWKLVWDADAAEDAIADAEAEASVRASLATGLPPREAGALTLREAEAYGDASRELERARGGRG